MNKKKLLALLLALVMTLSLVPVTAFAAVTHSSVYVKYRVYPEGAATLGENFSDYILLEPTSAKNGARIPSEKQITPAQMTPAAGYVVFNTNNASKVCLNENGETFISVNTAFTSSAYSDKRQEVVINGETAEVIYLYLLFKESAQAADTHTISVAAYPSNVTQNAAIFDGTTKSSADLSEGTKLNIGNTTSPYLYAPPLNGYSFRGWKLADGEGKPTGEYLGDSYTVGTEDALLLAVYEEAQYTVSFASDDTSKGTVSDGTLKVGTASPYNRLIFSDLNSYANPAEGYQLVGWKNGSETVLDANHTFDVTGDITLTAVFELIPEPEPEPEPEEPVVVEKHTVTFDTDHGSAVEAKTVDAGTTVTRPTDPKRIGYTFDGWYSGDTVFNFDTPITSDLTLTAQWAPEAFFDDSNDEVRIAGQIDLFGADLRSFKDYSGSLTLYRGYEGFSDDTASIKVAKRNYEDGTYVGTDTNELDVANVGVDGLGVDGLNYNALYGVLQSFVKNNIAKNTWVIQSGESSVTYTMTPDTDGAYGYTTVTATPDTSENAKAVMDAISSSANFTYSRNGGSGSWVAYFPAGSYFSMNDKGQTVGSAGVAAPLKDHTGEFSMEEFRTAFFHGGLSTVQTMEDKGSFYLYLKAGFYIDYGTNGEERLFLNKDLAVRIDGFVNSAAVLEYINTDHPSGTSLSEIGDLLNFIPQNATITITINYVDPVVVAKIGDAEYTSLQAAVDAAENGDIIKLVGSFEQNAIVTIPEGKTVTLDLAEETLTLNASKDRLFVNNGNLTIKNGTIAQVNTGSYGVIKNKGTLIIDGITITDAGQATGATVKNESGTLLIKSNTSITATGTASGNAALYNVAEMTVEDGVTLRNHATDEAVSGYGYGLYCVRIDGGTSTFGTKEGTGVTIEGNRGGIAVNGGAAIINSGSFSGTKYYGLWVTNDYDTTDVTINGGTFIGKTYSLYASVDDGNQDVGNVALTVNNGYFQQILKGDKDSNNTWTIAIKGGYFKTAPATTLLASGFEVVDITNNSDAEAYQAGYRYKVSNTYVAQVGTTQYPTVEAAIAAATDSQTVELLCNASMTGTTELTMNKSITLDLAGHTLTAERINLNKGGLNVVTSVAGGTVTSSGQTFNVYGSETNAANYTTLTIGEGVTVNGNYAVCLFPVKDMVSYGATININGTLTGSNGTLFVSGNLGNSAETGAALASSANISVINVGATAEITSSGDQAIAMNGMAKVNVASGAVITGREAVGLKRGILNVSGGTFTANGAKVANPTANNNGTEATGAALSITSTYNYAGNIQANISGGYFTSVYGAAFLASQAVKNAQAIAFADGNPILNITGGVFKDDTVKTYVASGYEAAALNGGNSYGGETADYNGWYKVGVLTVSGVATAAQITENYDATYTATKTVTAEDNNQQLAAASAVTVNVVTTKTESPSSAVVANTNAHTTEKYDVASVVESAIDMANTTDTTLNVSIDIVSDNPAVDTSTEIPTITYEIHPVATVTSKTGDAEPTEVGSFKVTNDQLKDGASFDLQLTVPDAVYNAAAEADSKRYVIAKHVSEENASTETYKREIKGAAGGYYIELTVTHFSQFELEPMTLTNAVYGEAKVSATLSLSDSIDIIFYVKDIVGDVSHYTVEYSFADAVSVEKPVTDGTPAGDGKYGFTVASCAAKQMTDTVSFKVKYDGVVIFSINDYSIQSYCENKIAASGTTAKLRELCYAVLDYGASAQNFFDYETSNIANATYSNMSEVEALTLPNNWAVTTTGNKATAGISKISATLNTVSQTEIYFYITPTGSQKANDYTVSAVDATNVENTPRISCSKSDQSDGRILVVVRGIAAKYLGDQYTLTVNGEYTVTYSPMSYAYNKQNGANGLGNLVKAMYQYSVKAAAFFE